MTAGTEGVVHYDVTRVALVEALGGIPLGEKLLLEARGRMADALLGQMPEARGEAEIRAEEREKVAILVEAMAGRVSDYAVPIEGDRWTTFTAAGAIRSTWLSAAALIREQS